MAINLIDKYSNRVDSTDPEYPLGKAKNQEGGVVGTGTPVDQDWLNDIFGFQQALLSEANITASGVPDSLLESQYLSAVKFLTNSGSVNPSKYGVTYGSGLTLAQRQANTVGLQQCIDENTSIIYTGTIETYGSVFIRSFTSHQGIDRVTSGVRGYHPTEPVFKDSTLTAPDAQGNNISNVTFYNMFVRSELSDCFHITPYQCRWDFCKFTSLTGNCFRIHDGGYQAENKWVDCYFYRFNKGIYAPGGFRNLTDFYTKDNYFFSDTTPCYSMIEVFGCSGSIINGDHFYGNCEQEYVQLSAFINMRINNCYFERSDNARLYLQGGNPCTLSVTGNSFWGGDGNVTDHLGDKSSLIKFRFNEFNRTSVTLAGNSFEGGENSVPVINLLNGDFDSTRLSKISVDKSNGLNGDYVKSVLGASGTATHSWAVVSDIPELALITSTQNVNYSTSVASYIVQEDTGSATSFTSLPEITAWLGDRDLRVENRSTLTSISFSAGGSTTILGVNVVPPNSTAYVTRVDASTYYIKVRNYNESAFTLRKETGITLNFTPTTIPANGESRANITGVDGYTLVPSDVVNVNVNNLPDGVSASVYYDNITFNGWKVKLVNTTGSGISFSSALANATSVT